ncbi:histone-lysine N-methyltransferase 2C isoform X1 [Alosa alosa]|uniref:histone-lysine N-methyltransferase 2C isoform X1 n=1 Tax=Alosa alosa TaxID=278164 RepID=UPI0020152E9C|nr:histone-lysine N-methyltransferase 2C isoform X1 [Alosa alosa]
MSSEDKSLDTSDKGPPPPPGSTGATPTGSPAPTDRRPRGRPRKDAVSAAPLPGPATKPPKKSRSRGRALLEDEEVVETAELAELTASQEIEPKEQQEMGESAMLVAGDGEGEDSPSFPLHQTQEAAAPPSASSSGVTKSSEQLCAFCYCGGRSLLGQGDLRRFEASPTPSSQSGGSTRDGDGSSGGSGGSDPDSGAPRPTVAPRALSSAEEGAGRFWDELSHVGLPDGTDVQTLFDESGRCWAHQRCAVWSQDVCQGEDQSLLNVDQAIHSGSTQCCAYCKRLGASIKCCEEGCDRMYHYPCAGAAGTFQDFKRLLLFCPDHIELAIDRSLEEANCVLCDSPGDLQDQLFCTSCGLHYHGMCLDIAVTPLKRAGWQCPECKVCQTCKNPGEDTKMLVCDMCDKGYHTFCLQPAMDSIPAGGWRCKNCRVCDQCGTRTSGHWHHSGLLCEACAGQQDPALACPLCGGGLDPELQPHLLSCHSCKRWLHLECEQQVEGFVEPLPGEHYVCCGCQRTSPDLDPPHRDLEARLMLATVGAEEPGDAPSEPQPSSPMDCPPSGAPEEEERAAGTGAAGCGQAGEQVSEAKPELESEELYEVTCAEEPRATAAVSPEDTGSQRLESEAPEPPLQAAEPEPSQACTATAAPQEEEPEPGQEKHEAPTPPTKEPTDASAPAVEEAMEVSGDVSPAAEASREATGPTLVPKEERATEKEEEVEKKKGLKVEKEPSSMVVPVKEKEDEAQLEHPVDMETTSGGSILPQPAPPAEAKGAAHKPSSVPDVRSESTSPCPPQVPLSPHTSLDETVQAPLQLQLQLPLPETEPEPPFSPVDFSTAIPPAMFLPMTPKIGMGKPAITKRKFSPGRPRVKQGAWRGPGRAVSPSWSLEPPKTRQPTSTPAWGIRVGRGSGFPGRRRPRGAGLSGRGGRGRSRMKNGVSPVPNPGVRVRSFITSSQTGALQVGAVEPSYLFKEEEENAMHNTVVLFSSSDSFTLKQDMCVVCGSFGQGVEGRLLACAQCGQCYHPFCVNIKLTRVVLSKGWRCLECTVCEACGQATDPARLLLCDDCDISYHTYCLNPPLQNVPNGGWKCKWCVSCTQCGATSPGLRGEWQNNYTQCAPCGSLSSCPSCLLDYSEEEIIVQCRQCDRWVHASCQGLHSEQEVEVAVDNGFDCTQCRGRASPSETIAAVAAMAAAEAYESPLPVQTFPKAKDLDPARTYTQDGVCLTESGLSQLQSLAAAASRRRRPKPKLKLKIINQNSVAVLQSVPDQPLELSREVDLDDSREGEAECEGKSDSSPEREVVDDDSKGGEAGKKRKRKPYRPGIGGFMVRQRNKAGQAKAKPALTRKDSTGSLSEIPPAKDETWGDPAPDTPQDEKPPVAEFPEKTRKRYRKKKTKLEEAFPTYLQEAFFGKDLLDKSKQSRQGVERGLLEEEHMQTGRKTPRPQYMSPSAESLHSNTSTAGAATPGKAAASRSTDDPLVALTDVLNTDTDLLGILSGDLGKPSDESGLDFSPFQVDGSPPNFAGLDMAEESPAVPQTHSGRAVRGIPEEPLGGILSPELDKMVTDESILSKLYKIPELEGKDVEDLFTAVLSPSTSRSQHQQQQGPSAMHGPQGGTLPHPPSAPGNGMFPRMPMVNGLVDPSQQFSPSQMNPGAGSCMTGNFSPLQRMPFPDNMREHKFHPVPGGVGGAWAGPGPPPAPGPGPGPGAEGEGDSMSTAQKSTLKWEKEETLGELATVAPVLYTNVNFPDLKEEYPDWSTRVKQIAKLWRKASSQDRAPYVQKARDNRAALRINKVQMSNEPVKRPHAQQPVQLPQPPEVFDPAIPPLDTELLFKDPLKHKESEQEQEWKLRQVRQLRQKSKQQAKIEATQKLEQVKNEQLQQQQQQQQQTGSGADGENSGGQSPLSQSSSGNLSPMQQPKSNFSRPPPSTGSKDDIFLRPQLPPPSAGGQGSSSQPQSPQMFSPGSSGSRPSSPGDPYAKMVGTPRPPPMGTSVQRRGSIESGKSPRSLSEERGKHEPFGSPTSLSSDPYAKPPDTPRPVTSGDPFLKPMGPPRASPSMEGRHMMGSPGHDPFSRPAQRKEAYQRGAQNRMILSDPYSRPLLTPIPGSNESGSVQLFKAPMPPGQAQDPYGGMHPGQRRPSGDPFERLDDPYAQSPLTPRPAMGQEFASPQRPSRQPHQFSQPGPVMRQSAQNPYVHAPPTPRPDYSQYDPYSQPPGTPRPMSDPYAHPPGTPRPHDQYSPSSDPYSHPPTTPRPGPRLSPSLAVDPYAQQPGTPHPGMGDRFPKSPGCQRNPDPYAQPPGTPRPMTMGGPQQMLNDPYAQPPGTPRPGGRPGSFQDPFSPPQARAQEAFAHPMVPGSQTPKHPGMHDESVVMPSNPPNQTPVHDPFEQAPMTPHPQVEKESQGMVGHGLNPMGTGQMPHPAQFSAPPEAQSVSLMEAEERMRQRQRIRELILKQQQQKGANRQEKGPQEAPMAPGTPQHWSQGGPGPQVEIFNRPPPPYPGPGPVRGPMRFPGPFPGDQHGPVAMEGQFPDGSNMGIRQHMQRFGFPSGQGPHGPLRPPHPMQDAMMDAHPQMRRSISVELGKSFGGPPMGPQHFPPRGMPVQQHNIMGQPFIELRHRAPESRFRLPFGPAGMQGGSMDPHAQQHRLPGFNVRQQMGFPPNQGPRPMEGTMMNQHQGSAPQMQMSSSMDNLNQSLCLPGTGGLQQPPLMRSMSQPASSESSNVAPVNLFPVASTEHTDEISMPSTEGEKLDADESAVKDLEDVEVKDLVDADLENLNLDAEDGKDLDLETNDLHLDDFLTSGKFDIIAYTETDLDLDVKKDMFNEDLDLSDPIEDHNETSDPQKALSEKRNTGSGSASTKGQSDNIPEAPTGNIKQEACSSQGLKEEPDIKLEPNTSLSQPQGLTASGDIKGSDLSQPTASQLSQSVSVPDSTPVLSSLLVKEKPGEMSLKQVDAASAVQNNPEVSTSNILNQSNYPQQDLNPTLALEQTMGSTHGETAMGNSSQIQGQAAGQAFGSDQLGAQDAMLAEDPQAGTSLLGQNRPLLLEEQPLLLQDLLDQERQEQQQQRQMQAMIRQRSSDSFFPNIDFDAITDPIMKAKMVALKGINKVMVQNNMGMTPMTVMNRLPQAVQQGQGPPWPEGAPVAPQVPVQVQDAKQAPHMGRPNLPAVAPGFSNDAQQKAQYEEWLRETQQLLQMQQKFLEEQIGAHRKSKKALSAKQRTAKKAGREFPEEDAEQLKHVTEQQGVVQKQLEQIRKQQKEHAELIEEYRVKQQPQCNMQPPLMPGMPGMHGPPAMMPVRPPMSQPMIGPLPQMPQIPVHPGQPGPARPPNMPPGWRPGGPMAMPGPMPGPMPMGGPRMPPMMPVQGPMPQPPQVMPAAAPAPQAGGESPHVNFDDTNPFSEGFQERERKERLREQQERQRVQLMKEVERQRALKQRMEMEMQQQQQALMSPEGLLKPQMAPMPMFNQEMPHDFLQAPKPPQPQHPGQMFPQQQGHPPGLSGEPPGAFMGNGPFPQDMGPGFWPDNPGMEAGNFAPGQPRPPRFGGPNMMPHNAGKPHPFGPDSSLPLPPNFPGSGPSLIQLYSNIIPEEKGKKKRNRKKKKDDDSGSLNAPSTPHSDLTAPLTPCVSDTSSTPTRLSLHHGEQDLCESSQPGSSTPGSATSQPPSELERQLSGGSCGGGGSFPLLEGHSSMPSGQLDRILSNIKLEQVEGASECHGPRAHDMEHMGMVKMEAEKEGTSPHAAGLSPAHSSKGEMSNELLKHLLKHKRTPPAAIPHQRSEDSLRSEEDGCIDSKNFLRQNSLDSNGTVSDSQMSGQPEFGGSSLAGEQTKRKQRNKRGPKGAERPVPRSKKRRKEEEERKAAAAASDPAMTHLKQLSLLPLMEPLIGVNYAHFMPYGGRQLDGENRLSGSFGSATLDGVSDYYSQLIYKQNNLSNPPTPPASLPPTPPPVARQKILNGFATTEELASKAVMAGHDVTKGLLPRSMHVQLKAEEELLARALSQGPKTVDVPASLPTPPHNNQEELSRGQEHCEDRDSPDSFVPSSSPESVVGMEVSRYPDLSLVKQERPSPAQSPVIPLLPSCSGKEAGLLKIKKEQPSMFYGPPFGAPHNGSNAGLVSIAITLKPAAAENITGVVAAIADLLHVKIPSSYEVSSAPDRPFHGAPGGLRASLQGPELRHSFMLHGAPGGFGGPEGGAMRFIRPPAQQRALHMQHQQHHHQQQQQHQQQHHQQQQQPHCPSDRGATVSREQFLKGQASPGSKPQWCRHCKVVVLGSGVRKSPKDGKPTQQDIQSGAEGDVVFCSHSCLILHSASSPAKAPVDTKESVELLPASEPKESPSRAQHPYSNNMSSLDVHCLAQLQPKPSPPLPTSPLLDPPSPEKPLKAEPERPEIKPPETLRVTVKLKSRSGGGSEQPNHHGKRHKAQRWQRWSVRLQLSLKKEGHAGASGAQLLDDEVEVDRLLAKLAMPLRPSPALRDRRRCCFCHQEGDGLTDGPARLLNLDLDTWVHLNCALWSTEVYETQAGALINVELALRRGTAVLCVCCQRSGATTGCHRLRCLNIYHFTCALQAGCTFFKDKTMLCHAHRPRGQANGRRSGRGPAAFRPQPSPGSALLEHQLRCFSVFRRVYVQRDEVRQLAGAVQRPERGHTFRVGSLVFHAMGHLLPAQMAAFHSDAAIFPVGYEASRLYWSMRHANRRCRYLCSVEERGAWPEFTIRVQEPGYEELVLTDSSPKGVWDKVLCPVAERRAESSTLRLFPVYLKGEDLFGLTVTAVARIAESLPGVQACKGYRFRFGRNPMLELPLAINLCGSARAQARSSPHHDRLLDESTACSRSIQNSAPPEGGTPYSKHFVHSKSSQYRRLQSEWKANVYLAQSHIQGLGLFAARDIEKQTMVIEYLGNILRKEVASRKEFSYKCQNRAVYMFRIDNEHILDATLTGGLARYINHSCAPNCVAEVVTFERGYKIIISSNRRIEKGEELCYDYKFDQADDQHKIPCHCGAVNCRKWIN